MPFNELTLLRALAIILITNSHIDHLYPIKYLGTGGSLGNSIFFLISAIGLTWSLNKKSQNFLKWYKKRFLRIYPLMWIVGTIYIVAGKFIINNFLDFIKYYLFPKEFWFLPAIILFYIPIYYIIKYYSQKLILVIFSLLFLIYCLGYIFFIDKNTWSIESCIPFKSIFYFAIMVMGVYIANNYEKFSFNRKNIFLFFILIILFFGIKGLMLFNPIFYKIQFILHIITIFIMIYMLKVAKSQSLISILSKNIFIRKLIILLATITLEIYLFQSLIYSSKIVISLYFPVNIVLFFLLTILLSFIIHIFYYYFLIKKIFHIKYKI